MSKAQHAPGQSRYFGSEVYVAKPDETGRVRLDLLWPLSGTGRYGESNVARVCDEECAGEIERRWNAHDDLLAACEALIKNDGRGRYNKPGESSPMELAQRAIAKTKGTA